MEDNIKSQVPPYLIVGKVITYAMYIWVIFGIIILGIRVFLLAFSANAGTPFVNFIYNTSASFLEPFRGIFPPKSVGTTGYLDVAALFAMIMYGLIGWGFAALIHYIQSKIDFYTRAAEERADRRRQMAQAQALAPQNSKSRPATRTPKQI
jgi:uncharacterized protein YggT (Ycf19 family)